jgi:hypothetical protein
LAYPLNYMLNVVADPTCQERDYSLTIGPGSYSGSNNTNLPLSTSFFNVKLEIKWAATNVIIFLFLFF